MKRQVKSIMARILLPLCFLIMGYGILIGLALPYIRPVTSIYNMLSQNQTPDFSDSAKVLYQDHQSLPDSGTIQASTLKHIKITDEYGEIEIDSVNIQVPLIYGATDECLHKGAGLRIQSFMPGYNKPIMIGGHTIPYFKNLVNIHKNDIIKIRTYYGLFEYKVSHTAIANASDTSAYDLSLDKEQLILFTCYPVEGIGEKEDRYFVYADKVSGPCIEGDIQ